MNNKNYFIFAAAIALASCSVDEYMGENPEFTQTTKENIIGFGGGTGSMSRATSNTGPTNKMLDNQFKVYGWKTTTTGTQKVFDNYWVWYSPTATPSNPETTANPDKSWEYVGKKDYQFKLADNVTNSAQLPQDQYIKYWDYSATDYKFVAGSPIDNIEFRSGTEEDSDPNAIATATVSGLGGHITPNTSETSTLIDPAPVYIAQPTVIKKDKYKKAVNLQFTRLQTKVRVGIYETIKGYSISAIKFYKQGGSGLEEESTYANNVVLTSSGENFYGGTNVTATVNYYWDEANNNASPSFTYAYNNAITKQKNWYGGKFENGIKATSSNDTSVDYLYGIDNDRNAQGYFTVIPNNNNQAIIIKCDYTLTAEDKTPEGTSPETINVTGATAAIPAAYCKWEPNKMYTYIFKISQETNGTTGNPEDDDPAGLFPITFDAVATAEENTTQGYETIINTPSITTYQAGSVTDNGIEYKTGKEIEIKVQNDNVAITLNTDANTVGCLKVYKFTALTDEATLQVSGITGGTEITSPDLTVNSDKATFTPDTDAYYAIQYCYSVTTEGKPVYKYKVIKVGNPTSSGN